MNQNTRVASFAAWKKLSPVVQMADGIGFDIEPCHNWEDYGTRFRAANDSDGDMVNAARNLFGGLSTGERPVLVAMLHAADFSWLADELSGNETWTLLSRTYGNHAAAVAFAIMRP
jgi:hypothetical protein